jgi:hypothetical protein
MAQIKKTNNWEYYKYYFNNIEVPEDKNGVLQVEYPDGTQASIDYISDRSIGHYSDHGHNRSVNRYELFGIINHHGLKMRVPVENLNVIQIKGIK